mgnify:CR=1 FL=1
MMGCRKFIEVDKMLRMVKKSDLLFGGLNVLLVGDFAQLDAVKQDSLHDALVHNITSLQKTMLCKQQHF